MDKIKVCCGFYGWKVVIVIFCLIMLVLVLKYLIFIVIYYILLDKEIRDNLVFLFDVNLFFVILC